MIDSTANQADFSDVSASVVALTEASGAWATTGSNTFNGNQTINGDVTIDVSSSFNINNISTWRNAPGSNITILDVEDGIQIRNFLNGEMQIDQNADADIVINNEYKDIHLNTPSGAVFINGVDFEQYSASVDTRLNNAQGVQGIQGTQGTTGGQGSQGIQGLIGTQGSVGSQGAIGTQGSTGTQGQTGGQGIQGIKGNQGATGVGAQGAQGYTGNDGAQGSTGAQGATGNDGAVGLQGAQGYSGNQGAQGIKGSQGAIGAGTQGAQGANGTQGSIGSGSQGQTGTTGTQGQTGTQGAQGISGTAVAQGAQGAQGATGNSINTGSFATTGSNEFNGNQIITGSLQTTGSGNNIRTNQLSLDLAGGNQPKIDMTYSLSASAITYSEPQTNLPQYLNQAVKAGMLATGSLVGGLVKVYADPNQTGSTASGTTNGGGLLFASQSTTDWRYVFGYNGNPQSDGQPAFVVQRGLHKLAGNATSIPTASLSQYPIGSPVYWSGQAQGACTLNRPTNGIVLRLGYIAAIENGANPYVREIWYDPVWEEGETLYNFSIYV